jgi:acyl-CoA synthetase (AMP-forming)/AMP-acid ligase II
MMTVVAAGSRPSVHATDLFVTAIREEIGRMLVGDVIARAVRRYADQVAVEGPGGQRTYAQLGERMGALGAGLRRLGLAAGDRVLDLQTNQVTYIETDLALASSGLVRVALNYRLRPADWEYIADDCGARALIYDARFADPCVGLRSGMDHVVVVGDGPGTPYEKLIADNLDVNGGETGSPQDLVSLNYSSGTTGRPKGAKRTHRNRLASLRNMLTDVLPAKPAADDLWIHAGPVTHTSGLFTLPYFAYGARQLILPEFDPAAVLDAIEHRGGTATALVPTMVARLLALPDCTPDRTRGLRMLGYAGAPMAPDQIRQAYERITTNLVQYYGLVEAIPPVTVLDAADHARGLASEEHLLGSAGQACLTVDLWVVDDEGIPLAAGTVGEVVTRGEHVMDGYWRAWEPSANGRDTKPDAPEVKSIANGTLHTGDLGRLDENGYLYLVDRKGDMIISGGYNIYPREIEDVIASVPGVHEVAVVGIADPDWGERVTALYTVHQGATVTSEAILDRCRASLASYKKPKDVRQVGVFPLNSTGKIAKKVLRERLQAGEL